MGDGSSAENLLEYRMKFFYLLCPGNNIPGPYTSLCVNQDRRRNPFRHVTRPFFDKMQNVPQQNLYALLNVNKDSDDVTIKQAYKRAVLLFHPDRFVDVEKQKVANCEFILIQRAFDILSNPGSRHIYDMYGEKGLESSWEIGSKFKSKEEVCMPFQNPVNNQ